MSKGFITKSMLDNLNYDEQNNKMETETTGVPAGQPIPSPTAMFVFARADLNAAVYHLIQSLKSPFASGAIATLFVQEAVLERFLNVLKPQLSAPSADLAAHAGYKQALELISRLNARTIAAGDGANAAVIVCDTTHEFLGVGASGIVTLHNFRTAKEAIALFGKETLKFENVSIWNENHSCAYELVAALRCSNFFINCNQVSLEPLRTHIAAGGNHVTMEKSYHYETYSVDGQQKSVVFPVGTIFAN